MNKLLLPSVLICIAALITSCTSLKSVNSDTKIGGITASKSVIVVPNSYQFKRYTLPEGTYKPIFEDPDGIYYEAPGSVVVDYVLGGVGRMNGGVYFKFSDPKQPYFYVTIDGDLGMGRTREELPSDFRYTRKSR